jgi:shikimate kinase
MTAAEDGPALVLIGAPGAGKTRVGKRVAKLIGLPFIDTDKVIVTAHGPISDIFAEHGEPHFRALERAAVESALHERAVVSLGGGAVLDLRTQEDLGDVRVVQLTVEASALAERNLGDKRPLLAGGLEAWKALVAARAPIYEQLADKTIDTTHRPVRSIASEIVDWMHGEAS